MTIQEALRESHLHLQSLLPYPEMSWKECETLLGFVLKQERTWLMAHGEESLLTRQEKAFFSLIERRAKHEPIAYLIKSAEFCGMKLEVTKAVLIPRIETEELVERATNSLLFALGSSERVIAWDVGTGSGAMAITLKKRVPRIDVIASDVSGRALQVAKRNALQLLSEDQQPIFFRGSLLTRAIQEYIITHQPNRLLILANLPYLPYSDKTILQKDVVDYEPAMALFAHEDGNALITKLMQQLAVFIKEYSLPLQAYFEFDPPQAHALKAYALSIFPLANVTIHTDVCGRERFLEIQHPRTVLPSQKNT